MHSLKLEKFGVDLWSSIPQSYKFMMFTQSEQTTTLSNSLYLAKIPLLAQIKKSHLGCAAPSFLYGIELSIYFAVYHAAIGHMKDILNPQKKKPGNQH